MALGQYSKLVLLGAACGSPGLHTRDLRTDVADGSGTNLNLKRVAREMTRTNETFLRRLDQDRLSCLEGRREGEPESLYLLGVCYHTEVVACLGSTHTDTIGGNADNKGKAT